METENEWLFITNFEEVLRNSEIPKQEKNKLQAQFFVLKSKIKEIIIERDKLFKENQNIINNISNYKSNLKKNR